ncbi:MAG: hypothetical protein ACOYLQ_16800 [Hyphomicrobiaceae bacterium]
MRVVWIIVFSQIIFASLARADGPPRFGLLGGRHDRDFMEFRCQEIGSGTIDCDFVQVKVTLAAKPADLAEKLAKAADQEAELRKQPMDAKMCRELSDMEQAIRTGVPSGLVTNAQEFKEGLAAMTAREKEDVFKSIGALKRVCESPTRANIEFMIRAEHDKLSRTCKVWLNQYKQRFNRQPNGNVWASSTPPSGECGVVNVSTLTGC